MIFTETVLQIENMIVHPQYNSSTSSHLADLAVLKLEPRSDVGSVQWGNYTSPACLPLPQSQVEDCQVGGWAVTTQGRGSLRSAVLGHKVSLQPGEECLQEPLKASAVQPHHLLCASTRCNRFVTGPVFCRSQGSCETAVRERGGRSTFLITERYHVLPGQTGAMQEAANAGGESERRREYSNLSPLGFPS